MGCYFRRRAGIDVDDCRRHALDDRREGQLKLRSRARHLTFLGARACHLRGEQKDEGGGGGSDEHRSDKRGFDTRHRGITPNQ